ncbi:hypothetical protein P1P75_40295 [Streptomyces sp. ID05-39B]|uniref:hypothetical protein n=1 Tax=Streptomyces sp. ID05-39B TaxID=3028664 RepID=UPI0029A4CEBE|nr:hypothetical protein [Streptomyces sp. ID05-39B]MDX3532472.1 hypothetical protein [Streptomyces sp. ID05-39B]
MGQDIAGAAAKAFRLLNSPELRQPARTAPTGRRSPSTTPQAPLDIGLVDYLDQHYAEVITHTRALTDGHIPVPRQRDDIYEMCTEALGNADQAQRLQAQVMLERHRLEHAVRLGDVNVVCKEFCPGCGCLGLMWAHAAQRARCTNKRCRTPDGVASNWTLARLAAQKVHQTEKWRRNAT